MALTLTRLASDESEGPGALERRMRDYLGDLEQRNGTAYLELVAITLALVYLCCSFCRGLRWVGRFW